MEETLRTWMEARFDSLRGDINRIFVEIQKLDDEHDKCRDHCDATSKTVFIELADLKRRDIEDNANQILAQRMGTEFQHAEESRFKMQQNLWLKIAAIVTLANGLSAFMTAFLASYWGR